MDKVERAGTGIQRMKDKMKEAGLPTPEFKTGNFFTALFRRPTPQITPQITPQKPTKLEKELLNLISANNGITREEIALQLKLSPETIKEYLAKLKEKNY